MCAKPIVGSKIWTLSKTFAYADGNGLYLQVRNGGDNVFRSWIFRYMRNGVAHNMGLGSLSVVSLAEARLEAARAQKLLHDGTDPLAARKNRNGQTLAPTFGQASKRYIEIHRPTWKNAKHAAQWTNTMRDYAEPIIGKVTVDAIRRDHILRIVEPVWLEKPETATRIRGRIEKILDWASVEGYRDGENPARWKGNLEHSLLKRPVARKTNHHPAQPWKELPVSIEKSKNKNERPRSPCNSP